MNILGKSIAVLFFGSVVLACWVYADSTINEKESQKPAETQIAETQTTENSAVPAEKGGNDTSQTAPKVYWIGVRIIAVPDLLTSHFGVKEPEKGLVAVEYVVPESPAGKAGLKRGDIILQFGSKEIHMPQDLIGQVAEVKDTAQPMNVIRDGSKTSLTVTPAPQPENQGRSMPMDPSGISGLPKGMKLGQEFFIGPRDPQKMLQEMQELMQRRQGEGVEEEQLILPDEKSGACPNASSCPNASACGESKSLQVSSHTDKDGKTKIHVTQTIRSGGKVEEKKWEAESVDELPPEIRQQIKGIAN